MTHLAETWARLWGHVIEPNREGSGPIAPPSRGF